MKKSVHYIKNLSIKSIRDFILDQGVSEGDSLALNQTNFDELVLEYRKTYQEGLQVPYYLMRVLIKEDLEHQTPVNRIKLIRNDESRFEEDYNIVHKIEAGPDQSHAYDEIYRCGYCGDVVDGQGNAFDSKTRLFKISVFDKFEGTIQLQLVEGKCCINRSPHSRGTR